MASTKVIRISRPFTKGWVTDRPRWALDQQEMANGQDVFWPRGIATRVGGWGYVGDADPLGSTTTLGGVMAVQFDPLLATITYVVTSTNGKVGKANASASGTAFTATNTLYLPRTVWNNEVLLCPQDGVSPILRWAGLMTDPTASAPTGTLTITRDRTEVRGAGTSFTTQAPKNSYLNIVRKGSFGTSHKVVQVESNTLMSIGSAPWVNEWNDRATPRPSASSVSWSSTNYGVIGLKALVTDLSTATIAGTAVTGNATQWVDGAPGHGPVRVGDFIGRKRDVDADAATSSINNKALTSNVATLTTASNHSFVTGQTVTIQGVDAVFDGTYVISGTPTATTFTYARTNADISSAAVSPVGSARQVWVSSPDAGRISVVGSDTSLTLSNSPEVFTNSPYVVLRSMPGKEVCAHQGRLWFTGIKWDPNRIYVSPTPDRWPDMGGQSNGEDSFDLDWASAAQAKFIDVPDRFAPGEIVALLSARNVLLVLRDNAVYGIFGSWPGVQVEMIADGAGCTDIRSTCSSNDGQFWCGKEGIYQYIPGSGIRDITEGRVNKVWRSLMYGLPSTAIVSAGIYNRHLVVSINADSRRTQTWLYDIAGQAWCGKLTNMRARAFDTSDLRGVDDELYMLPHSTKQIGKLSTALTDADALPELVVLGLGQIDNAVIAPNPLPNMPTFIAETGSVLAGTATDSVRTTQMRVGYECVGGQINVLTGDSNTSQTDPASLQEALPSTTYDVTTYKVRTKSTTSDDSVIGTSNRQFSVTFAEKSGAEPTRVAIHELQIVVREYDTRD